MNEVEGFLSEARRARRAQTEPEPTDVWLKRTLKELVLAHTQTRVAQRLGMKEISVAKPLRAEVSSQLATICRIAEAAGCEVTLTARAVCTPSPALPE